MILACKQTRCSWPLVALAAVLVVLLAQPALADKYWVGPNPNNYWTNANNWSNTSGGLPGAGQPGAGENIFLTQSDAINRTVSYNTALNLLYGDLYLDATGAGTITLQKSGNPLSAHDEFIGYNGTGIFNHNGGNNTLNILRLAALSPNSRGTYNLNYGNLLASGESVGEYGTGIFNQNSGTNTITNSNSLILGAATNSSGTYNLKGGSLSAGYEVIGNYGTGTFTQFSFIGSTNTVSNDLTLGYYSTGSGTYNLYPFSTLTVGNNETIGNNGTGSFFQFGGKNMVAGQLFLASGSNSSGTYYLKGGSLQVDTYENVGFGGTGIFDQTGGKHSVGKGLTLGGSSSGTYYLKGGSLKVSGFEVIGLIKTGTFTQSGGDHTVVGNLNLGFESGSSGTYNLMGGKLSAGNIFINGPTSTGGNGSSGTFNVMNTITTVTGDVVNHGTVKTTKAVVTWNGNFTNNGAYISDPATQIFTDLNVNGIGFLLAASQDVFKIKNDFKNMSTNASAWDTAAATLQFITGADKSHDFYIAGADHGKANNYSNSEFSWGTLNILGQTVRLLDGNAGNNTTTSDGAQYVKVLLGAQVNYLTGVVNNIYNDDASGAINIYYDPKALANFYLFGRDYTFAGGAGMLIADGGAPVPNPLPPSVFLLGSGLLGLGLLGWRRKRLMG